MFDPSWVPKFNGNLYDWFDQIVEISGYHPKIVAFNPNIIDTAGVSRKWITAQLIREVTEGTFLTLKSFCNQHNKKVSKGKASGWIEVTFAAWCGFQCDPFTIVSHPESDSWKKRSH